MTNKRVLVVSTYPIKDPKHGGQKRLNAIFQQYKENFKSAKFAAVFYKGFYSTYGPNDIHISLQTESKIQRSPYTSDIICGEAIYNDARVRKKFTKLLLAYKPDIIHIEQPYPYAGLKPLLQDLGMRPKIIFGSQNIEAPMKREILEGVGVDKKDIREAERTIFNLESELSRKSDLVIACTDGDMTAHKKMGAKRVVLAQNGIAPIQYSAQSLRYWQRRFKKKHIARNVLFVGSAHPPNWTGFFDMIGKGLGFVPHDTRIVIAGSICDYFDQNIKENSLNIEDATFWLRAFSAGRLSEDRLGALIELADVIVLPITEGGGSNLKTAEAIIANKKVVATTHALRSYEWFEDFPNVWVASTQAEFQKGIIQALNTPYVKRSSEQNRLAERVEWRHRLSDMVEDVSSI
ncbi:MAG: hypothetical protein AAB462_00870 [Patescibacteria group bacterium]